MTDKKRRARQIAMRVVAAIGLVVMAVGMIWSGQTGGASNGALAVGIVGVAIFVLAVPFCGFGGNRPPPGGQR